MSEAPIQAAGISPARSSRWAWILLALIAIVGLFLLARTYGSELEQITKGFQTWIAGLGYWGPAIFIAAYAVAVVAFIPASTFTLAAGALFGVVHGTAYTLIGATLGATAAFWIARRFARHQVEEKIQGDARFAAIDRAIAAEGRKIVFLLRLTPIFPFVLLNYALGLTKVSLGDYVIASVGMLPGTLLYVYLGTVASAAIGAATGVNETQGIATYVLQVVGLIATLAVTIVITRIARRALQEATER